MTHREVYLDWIEGITAWTTKLDMTFSWNCDEFRARKLFSNWMVQQLPSSTFLFSTERDPLQHKVMNTKQGLNQACHVHCISDTNWPMLKSNGTTRTSKWANWKSRYGRCRIEPIKSITAASGYALKKILNYSENREQFGSHVRKTDVDWDLQFGLGKRATERREEASLRGQEFFALGDAEFARTNSIGERKEKKEDGGLVYEQEDIFPWQLLGRKEKKNQ